MANGAGCPRVKASSTRGDDHLPLARIVQDQPQEMGDTVAGGDGADAHAGECVGAAEPDAHAGLAPDAERGELDGGARMRLAEPGQHEVQRFVGETIPSVACHAGDADDRGEAEEQFQRCIAQRTAKVERAEKFGRDFPHRFVGANLLDTARLVHRRAVDDAGDGAEFVAHLGNERIQGMGISHVALVVASRQAGGLETIEGAGDFVGLTRSRHRRAADQGHAAAGGLGKGEGAFGGDAFRAAGDEHHILGRPLDATRFVFSRVGDAGPGHAARQRGVIAGDDNCSVGGKLRSDTRSHVGWRNFCAEVHDPDLEVRPFQMQAGRRSGGATGFDVGNARTRTEVAATELDDGEEGGSCRKRRRSPRRR